MSGADYPEIGYTPANLRHLIKLMGITQAEAGRLLGVKDSTVRMWLLSPEKPSHRDMPLKQWCKLLEMKNSQSY